MMRLYFRGDERSFDEILLSKNQSKTGFNIPNPSAKREKYVSPFLSSNVIAFSSEIRSAVSFPMGNQEETYVYFVRDSRGSFYNLYGNSLKQVYFNQNSSSNSQVKRLQMFDTCFLGWANEYVSESPVPSKDIIGGVKIKRHFTEEKGERKIISAYQILEYQQNPEIKSSSLSKHEALLILKLKQDIDKQMILRSNVPKISEFRSIQHSMFFFYGMRDHKQVNKEITVDLATMEMTYAAIKAKWTVKEKNCQDNMKSFLRNMFQYTSFFSKHKIDCIEKLNQIESQDCEILFFELKELIEKKDDSVRITEAQIARLEAIAQEYEDIDKGNCPLLGLK